MSGATAPAVEAVILDLGNVLVFHDDALLFRRLSERSHLPPEVVQHRLRSSLWDAANRGQMTGEEIWRAVCRGLSMDLAAADFNDVWSCHFTVNAPVMPVVESLVGRVELLLLSNSNPLHVEHLRPLVPILRRFDHVLFSCEVGLVKPDPAFYREALRRAGTAPEQTAYFDDAPELVAAGQAVGLRAFQFTGVPSFQRQLGELGLI